MITLLDQETPDDIAAALAQRVRMRRKEQKLTQAQLSSKAGVSMTIRYRCNRSSSCR